jgi:hypothetical protein
MSCHTIKWHSINWYGVHFLWDQTKTGDGGVTPWSYPVPLCFIAEHQSTDLLPQNPYMPYQLNEQSMCSQLCLN